MTVSEYYDALGVFMNMSIRAYEERDVYYPVWGTCLGFLVTV